MKEEEREGFDGVFHFVESYSVMDHCVLWLLLGYLDTHTHMLAMCKRQGRTYLGPFPCSECAGEETPHQTTMPQAAALSRTLKSA